MYIRISKNRSRCPSNPSPIVAPLPPTVTRMSFDQLSSLESQPTTTRRQDDPQYADDPEFQRLSQELMSKLFTLTGNISRLSNEVALLGTKRDTERVRERVHNLLEDSKDTFKEVGEGVKKIQSWEDVSVCGEAIPCTVLGTNCHSPRRNTPNRSLLASFRTISRSSKRSSDELWRSSDHLHRQPGRHWRSSNPLGLKRAVPLDSSNHKSNCD